MSKSWQERFWLAIKIVLIPVIFIGQPYVEKWIDDRFPKKFISALLFFITANIIIDIGRITVVRIYSRQRGLTKKKSRKRDNFILGVNRISSVATVISLVFASFIVFETNIVQVFTTLSIVAAAIAILSKDYISNMINGLILMFSDKISLDDYIKVGNNRGKVADINFLHTSLLGDDGDISYLPNNLMLSTEIINYSKRQNNRVHIEFEISIDKMVPLDQLEEQIDDCLIEFEGLIDPESHRLKVVQLTKEAALMKFTYELYKPDIQLEVRIRRKVTRSVLEQLSSAANNKQ